MADDSWLDEELAELDQAERLIHETLNDFKPYTIQSQDVSNSEPPPKTAPKPSNYVMAGPTYTENPYAMAGPSKVTNASPKAVSDIDRLTNQLIQGLDTGKRKKSENIEDFNLPPPPDLDDFTFAPPSPVKSPDLPPPPPTSAVPNIYSPLPPAPQPTPAMSKAAPPPVMPKPSKSTPLTKESKSGVNRITIQLNKPTSTLPEQKPSIQPPPKPAPADPPSSNIPAYNPPPASTRPPVGPGARAGIPKDIKKNSEEELDFLTNNLLKNMENPKSEEFYGYCERCNAVVEGEGVGCTAMDRTFHISCFTCLKCHRSLHGEQFYCVDKDAWCDTCYTNSLERCTVCQQTITDRILRATNKPYHPQCFKCVVCGTSLDGIPFTVDDKNEVHCVEDYHK
uniref:LIM zinc-binding domain-containing protein n=1 Tax=Ciona savignyi TaxID=51511 RepID=H2ZIL0_CIOSA